MEFLAQYKNFINNSITVKTQTFFTSYSGKICLLLLGLIAVSFSSIFIHLGEQDLNPSSVVFSRFWITTVLYGGWIGFKHFRDSDQELDPENSIYSTEQLGQNSLTQNFTWSRDIIIIGIFLGFCFCANQVIWSWSLEHTSIANSTILHNLTPIFTALGAYLFLNQRFDNQFIFGMLLAIMGAISIEVADLSFGFDRFEGDIAALISALFYSGYLLAIEKLRDKLDIISIVFGCCFIGCILIFPLLLIHGDTLFPHTLSAWLSVIALAVVCQGVGQALIAYCLKTVSSGIVALLHLLCPCFTAIEAWLIFNQSLSIENLLGFTTILIGLYIGLSSSAARK
ncbi:DMT family transporter [Dapis sp. BLCC M229]|uniref:DMT family transporter n=1 Tax=Dapis sp. BLCC M229 TaxID=3400188 RepID=UPI003CEE8538